MTEQFVQVDTAALRKHATSLGAVADALRTAVDAGRQTAVASDAFGIFCSFLVPHASAIQQDGIDGLDAGISALAGVRVGLMDSATLYDDADDSASESFRRLVPPSYARPKGYFR